MRFRNGSGQNDKRNAVMEGTKSFITGQSSNDTFIQALFSIHEYIFNFSM